MMKLLSLDRLPGVFTWLAVILIVSVPLNADAQGRSPDQVEARALNTMEDPAARLTGVESFLERFPESRYRVSVLMVGILSSAELDPSSELVIDYAERYIEVYSERGGVASAYALAARTLHDAEVWPAKVDDYLERALSGEGGYRGRRGQAQALNIVAYIKGGRGEIEEAIKFEKEAIELYPTNTQFKISLARFLAEAGKLDEAEPILVESLIQNPSNQVARDSFEKIATQRTSDPSGVHAYRERVFGIEADRILAEADDKVRAKIDLVAAFSKLGVLHDRAMEYAGDLASQTGPESGADLYKASRIAIAQVQFDMGEYEKVLKTLEPALLLASGYDEDFHLLRGQSFEQLGKEKEALNIYLSAASVAARSAIMERLQTLWEKMAPGKNLDETLEAMRSELESWHPEGQFETPADWSGQVVLAELFTGSECPPCVASDIAFDGLIAFYPRSVNAVLVYHEHIPGPDPMANPDTEARMAYYTRDVVQGTPTAIINGSESSVGGGGATGAKGRFGLYRWMIEQQISDTPKVAIELEGSRTGQNVTMSATVNVSDPLLLRDGDLKLRVALAEELVHFTGANGVTELRMVVRSLIGGPDGYELDRSGGATEAEGAVDISALESDLLTYLSDWESENSDRFRNTPGFKDKKHEIDESQLFLVAFVQDDSSRKILQTVVLELN
jgi:tetratricopeptide (TPR) repeat protein